MWTYDRPRPALSSAAIGGGWNRLEWIVNAQVPAEYDRRDLADHGAEIAAELGLRGRGTVLLTAVDVSRSEFAHDGGVAVAASVGVTMPTWPAAPDASGDDTYPESSRPGTINLVAHLHQRLTDAALVNAVMTITEAKAQALIEAGIPGTGTASDAVCVVAGDDGTAHAFAGPRSPVGAALARATHAAVSAGLR